MSGTLRKEWEGISITVGTKVRTCWPRDYRCNSHDDSCKLERTITLVQIDIEYEGDYYIEIEPPPYKLSTGFSINWTIPIDKPKELLIYSKPRLDCID